MINLRALSFFKVQKLENSAEFAIFKGVPASLLSFGCFWKLLLLLLLLLLEDGCLLHASTPCSRSLHRDNSSSALKLLSWRSLNPHRRLCVGLPKVQMGRNLLVRENRCLQAAQGDVSLKSSQGGTTSFSGCNSMMVMMVAPGNNVFLRSPKLPPLEH